MDAQKKTELKVGLVSLSAILLLILGITLGKGLYSVMSTNQLTFVFPNSGGIEQGAPIVVNGVKRGSILEVKNQENGVLVTGKIDRIDDIKKDAIARITMLEITGGKKIEIDPGHSNEKFDPKNCLIGQNTTDLSELVSTLGNVSTEVVSLVKRLDTLTGQLTTLTSNKDFLNKIDKTFDNIYDLSGELNSLVKTNKKGVNELMTSARSLVARLDKAVEKGEPEVTSLLAQLKTTMKKIDALADGGDKLFVKADGLVTNVDGLLNDVKNKKSLVNSLLYDQSLKTQLDSTINQLNNLITFINQNGVNVNVRLGTRP